MRITTVENSYTTLTLTSKITHSTSKERNGAVRQLSSSMLHYQLCTTHLLHSSRNQEVFKKQLCNQSNHLKSTNDFHCKMKP